MRSSKVTLTCSASPCCILCEALVCQSSKGGRFVLLFFLVPSEQEKSTAPEKRNPRSGATQSLFKMSIVRHRLTIVWPGTGWLRENPTFSGGVLDVKARKISQVDDSPVGGGGLANADFGGNYNLITYLSLVCIGEP